MKMIFWLGLMIIATTCRAQLVIPPPRITQHVSDDHQADDKMLLKTSHAHNSLDPRDSNVPSFFPLPTDEALVVFEPVSCVKDKWDDIWLECIVVGSPQSLIYTYSAIHAASYRGVLFAVGAAQANAKVEGDEKSPSVDEDTVARSHRTHLVPISSGSISTGEEPTPVLDWVTFRVLIPSSAVRITQECLIKPALSSQAEKQLEEATRKGAFFRMNSEVTSFQFRATLLLVQLRE